MKRNQVLSLILICFLGVILQLGVTVQAKPPWLRNLRDFRVTISGDFAMVNPPSLTQSTDTTYWDVEEYTGEDTRFEISYVGYTEFNQPLELRDFYGGELINVYSVGHAIDDLDTIDPRDTWIILMIWEHESGNYYMAISSDWDSDGESEYNENSDTWTIHFSSDNTEIMQIKKEETYLDTVYRGNSGKYVVVERTRTIVVWDGLTDGFLNINLVVQRLPSN